MNLWTRLIQRLNFRIKDKSINLIIQESGLSIKKEQINKLSDNKYKITIPIEDKTLLMEVEITESYRLSTVVANNLDFLTQIRLRQAII